MTGVNVNVAKVVSIIHEYMLICYLIVQNTSSGIIQTCTSKWLYGLTVFGWMIVNVTDNSIICNSIIDAVNVR